MYAKESNSMQKKHLTNIFLLTPSEYSASGSSIDLNLVTLRQQNVENVPSLVCIRMYLIYKNWKTKSHRIIRISHIIQNLVKLKFLKLRVSITWK